MAERPASKIAFTLIRVAVGVGLLWYLGRSGAIQWSAVARLFRAWPVTLAAFLFLLVDVAVTAYRLTLLLRPRGFTLAPWASTRLALIGNFFNACLPGSTGGDLIKIYYAAEGNRGRVTEVATIILLDRAVGLFALMLWPLLAALFFPSVVVRVPALQALLAGAAVVTAIMLAGFLVARSELVRQAAWLEWLLQKAPLGHYIRRIIDTVHAYKRDTGTLVAATLISLVAHSMSTGITMLCAFAAHPDSFAMEMAVLIPIGQLANMVPLTPGGLGVGEAAFSQLFRMAGLHGGAEAMLGWRLLVIASGLVGLIFYLQGRQRYIHAQHDAMPEIR